MRQLLPLVAFCLDARAQALVYPLMEGGNLEDRLLLTDSARRRLAALGMPKAISPLIWRDRLRIIRDATRALVFLHQKTAKKDMILHRDIKATNILLDARCNAKLSDVGLAKEAFTAQGHTHVSTMRMVGTPGFIDPIVTETGKYNAASDAFAMGKVLLMCLTGKDVMAATEAGEDIQESPDTAIEHMDPTAGWPSELVASLVRLVTGLVYRLRRQRVPLASVLETLEELSTKCNLRSGVVVSDASRECIVCMAEPRAVRFACGHCICCVDCAETLVERAAGCPSCRSPIRIVERGEQLNEAVSFVAATWLEKKLQDEEDDAQSGI